MKLAIEMRIGAAPALGAAFLIVAALAPPDPSCFADVRWGAGGLER
jgi:hypothetical protein